jgi:predicted NAD/FAD-dependent oxidoreductase
MIDSDFDIAIIGAGIAGLTCAQHLQQAGYRVVVVEKSRGLGGRLATRRLQGTHADHGVCYVKAKDVRFRDFLDRLIDRKVVRVWTEIIHELTETNQIRSPQDRSPRYVSPTGISTIAKSLATTLTIRLNHRVERLQALEHGWQLQFGDELDPIAAKALIIAIPAPQAVTLIESLDEPDLNFLNQIKAVKFTPCISAIAVYPNRVQAKIAELKWQAIVSPHHDDLGWIGIDSTKQLEPVQPVLVIQSNAKFATHHLETTSLQTVGEHLLNRAAEIVAPWVSSPEAFQVHRWRYAFARNPLPQAFISATTNNLLLCTGDWCGGDRVESAFLAGIATAQHVNQSLSNSE